MSCAGDLDNIYYCVIIFNISAWKPHKTHPMATTIEELKSFLDAEKLSYDHEPGDGYIRTGFRTDNYQNKDGRNSLRLVIELIEGGEFIKFMAPCAYFMPKEASTYHKMALFQTLLQISWQTKMVQFEYDLDDGEIRANIEFPLMDSHLTQRQMRRCLMALANIIDDYHDRIQDAIRSGITPESDKDERRAFEEFMRQRREQRRREIGDA